MTEYEMLEYQERLVENYKRLHMNEPGYAFNPAEIKRLAEMRDGEPDSLEDIADTIGNGQAKGADKLLGFRDQRDTAMESMLTKMLGDKKSGESIGDCPVFENSAEFAQWQKSQMKGDKGDA